MSNVAPTLVDVVNAHAPPVVPEPMPLSVRCYGRSDTGRLRERNEDQFLIASLEKTLRIGQSSLHPSGVQQGNAQGMLFVVADGMGGVAGGDEASALAVVEVEQAMLGAMSRVLGQSHGIGMGVFEELRAALSRADDRVRAEWRARPELKGMGTTLTLAYVTGATLVIAHVGDSRCYLRRDGMLYQLTRDHTLVNDLICRGVLTVERAHGHELRHVVTNIVGGLTEGVATEVHRLGLLPGDVLLLCTDGLTEMLSDEEIGEVLAEGYDPKTTCDRLIELANANGGRDNVTVVMAQYERTPRAVVEGLG